MQVRLTYGMRGFYYAMKWATVLFVQSKGLSFCLYWGRKGLIVFV